MRVSGFDVKKSQIPSGAHSASIFDKKIVEVQRKASSFEKISRQSALRLMLGCNLDASLAVSTAQKVMVWRKQHNLAQTRESLLAQIRDTSQPIRLPSHVEVGKLVSLSPCALVAENKCPVSVWHVATAKSSAMSSVPDSALTGWSRATFEYVDIWLTALTEESGQLAGHIQIFNLSDVSFWMLTNSALVEKLKLVFGAGEFYVEVVSHIYVINTGSLFSMAWSMVKGFISPRTASKISVDSGIPEDLLKVLGPESARKLPGILARPHPAPPICRPSVDT